MTDSFGKRIIRDGDMPTRTLSFDALVVGGGIIPEGDVPKLKKAGVAGVFGPGTHCEDIVDFIQKNVKR